MRIFAAKTPKRPTMSEAILNSLLDYLYGTLNPSNMKWVAEHLLEQAKYEEEHLKPYTVEELMERAEEGRRQIAMGNYQTGEEVFGSLFEEFGLDPKEMEEIEIQLEDAELQYAEAV